MYGRTAKYRASRRYTCDFLQCSLSRGVVSSGAADGLKFFRLSNEEEQWNYLDALLVVTGNVQEGILFVYGLDGGPLAVLQVMRVMRLARVLRMVRVMGFFRELRMMWPSFLNCV